MSTYLNFVIPHFGHFAAQIAQDAGPNSCVQHLELGPASAAYDLVRDDRV